MAKTGENGVPDDSLGPVAEDVGGQFDDRVHAQEGDQCRHQPEGPVRVEAAVANFSVSFDIPDQHVGDQVTAQHEEGNDANDAGALKHAWPGMSQQDGANGGTAKNVQAVQPWARCSLLGRLCRSFAD